MTAQLLMTPTNIRPVPGNRLLESLAADDRQALGRHLTYVELRGGQCLTTIAADGPIVCFPLDLVASIVEVMGDGARFEVGLVGREGIIGWSTASGVAAVPQAALAQLGGGAALIVRADVLARLCLDRPTLHAAMLAFVQSFAVQLRHTIVANLRDGVERRLARWLLMLHDRVDGDVLIVTHGELAQALHVRRASITDTLHVLEGDHAVRCTRGLLTIRNRAALVAVAGDSYGPAEAAYRALIGDFGKG